MNKELFYKDFSIINNQLIFNNYNIETHLCSNPIINIIENYEKYKISKNDFLNLLSFSDLNYNNHSKKINLLTFMLSKNDLLNYFFDENIFRHLIQNTDLLFLNSNLSDKLNQIPLNIVLNLMNENKYNQNNLNFICQNIIEKRQPIFLNDDINFVLMWHVIAPLNNASLRQSHMLFNKYYLYLLDEVNSFLHKFSNSDKIIDSFKELILTYDSIYLENNTIIEKNILNNEIIVKNNYVKTSKI